MLGAVKGALVDILTDFSSYFFILNIIYVNTSIYTVTYLVISTSVMTAIINVTIELENSK